MPEFGRDYTASMTVATVYAVNLFFGNLRDANIHFSNDSRRQIIKITLAFIFWLPHRTPANKI